MPSPQLNVDQPGSIPFHPLVSTEKQVEELLGVATLSVNFTVECPDTGVTDVSCRHLHFSLTFRMKPCEIAFFPLICPHSESEVEMVKQEIKMQSAWLYGMNRHNTQSAV